MTQYGERLALDDRCCLYRRRLPDALLPDTASFEMLWEMRPPAFHVIKMHGRMVPTPRWQQAYGRAYQYSGSRNEALPISVELTPWVNWCCEEIDGRLNGLLINWYDGALGHYIGAHRDSTTGLIAGAPIVTISLGESRTFRLRPWKENGYVDFVADHGSVYVLPSETNTAWTHEIPKSSKHTGRRISLTFRAFE